MIGVSDLAKCILLLMVALLCLISFHAFSADVESVRLWRAPDHTRLVFDLSGPADHKVFPLQNPDRLVVDIGNSQSRASLATLDLSKTPIHRIRSAVRTSETNRGQKNLRFVLDLKSDIKPRSFLLKKHAGKPDRLVIDLYDQQTTTNKTIDNIVEAASDSARRDILIVIDAGHGGEDPGAIGPRGLMEKHVVLDIAKQLAVKINHIPGYQAKLTRTGDYYIALRKRRDFARKHRADLFVSVHADAFKTPDPRGASVFALSRRGATSETARFLAKKENDADLIGGVGDVSLNDKDDLLKGVLVDLSMTATISSSLDVGSHVLKQMGTMAHLHKRNVEQAGFLVLKSPDVPSILVETGFISNPKEERKLSTANYRRQMASIIFKGIRGYFEKSPPAGTYVAWKKAGGRDPQAVAGNPVSTGTKNHYYTVQRGDTLSGIADRYRMSLLRLKKINKLNKDTIRVGQKLIVVTETLAKQDRKHKVTSGDTLSAIALRYSSTVQAIRKYNRLNSSSIRIGQTLIIPAG